MNPPFRAGADSLEEKDGAALPEWGEEIVSEAVGISSMTLFRDGGIKNVSGNS
jgi:hypothetical protein